MKKILIILFLFVGLISAQTTTPKKNQIDGKYTQWKSAGGDTVSNGVHLTNGTLPLGTGGATSTNQSTQITRADSTMLLLKSIYYRLFNQRDSTTVKNILGVKQNQTNGTQKSQVVDGSGNVIGATSNALDINIKSGNPTSIGITSSTNSYATLFTTTGTTIDSVSFGFTTKSVTFINDGAVTDSLFVSPSSLFASTNKITRLGGEGFTKYWGVTKLYFKVGSTPLASKKIRIEGN